MNSNAIISIREGNKAHKKKGVRKTIHYSTTNEKCCENVREEKRKKGR